MTATPTPRQDGPRTTASAQLTLRVGDLFSGIGGMSLGLRMAGGFETRWFCEVDPFCVRVLNKHWPDVPVHGDIRELRGSDLEPIDILTAGFPCQPVSNAGLRLGEDDPRWLWPEVARLVRELRPRYVLLENVSALRGRGMSAVLNDLAACGYDTEWDCIPAAAVGAPHLRDRIWIVAYPCRTRLDRSAQPHIFAEAWIEAPRRHHANGLALAERTAWESEPRVCRILDGLPTELDRARLRGLGNAVVPQVVEWIGRQIVATLPVPVSAPETKQPDLAKVVAEARREAA